jgi:hypothetical protein
MRVVFLELTMVLSTYALETLVLYIFHIFNNSFAGPLEVTYSLLSCISF